jgi:hypothetical protein
LLLTRIADRRSDAAVVITATLGAWLLWSQYSLLSTVSWWYDHTDNLRSGIGLPKPDYDLKTLPWKSASPQVFDLAPGGATLVTNTDPFAYQVFAAVETKGANAVDIWFDVDIISGGTTIGILQGGKWIASNSSQRPGTFSDSNSAQLGYGRSISVVIANNNPLGETRLNVKALRLYLRK